MEDNSSRISLMVMLAANISAVKEQNARLFLEQQIDVLPWDIHRPTLQTCLPSATS